MMMKSVIDFVIFDFWANLILQIKLTFFSEIEKSEIPFGKIKLSFFLKIEKGQAWLRVFHLKW